MRRCRGWRCAAVRGAVQCGVVLRCLAGGAGAVCGVGCGGVWGVGFMLCCVVFVGCGLWCVVWFGLVWCGEVWFGVVW